VTVGTGFAPSHFNKLYKYPCPLNHVSSSKRDLETSCLAVFFHHLLFILDRIIKHRITYTLSLSMLVEIKSQKIKMPLKCIQYKMKKVTVVENIFTEIY
jgi:hypothetical protein